MMKKLFHSQISNVIQDKQYKSICFFILICVAIFPRLIGYDWGLPNIFHPDEVRIIDGVWEEIHQQNNIRSDYGPFNMKINAWFMNILQRINAVEIKDEGEFYLVSLIIGRWISCVFGFLTVLLIYIMALKLFNREWIAWVSGMALALSPLHIQLSNMATVDVVLTFFMTLTIFILQNYFLKPNLYLAILIGIVIGLALCVKPTAILLFAVGFFVIALKKARHFLWLICGAILTILLLCPEMIFSYQDYWWLNFKNQIWWHAWDFPQGSHRFLWNIFMVRGALTPLWTLGSSDGVPQFNFFINLLMGLGPCVALLGLMQIFVWVWRKNTMFLPMMLYTFILILSFSSLKVQFARYLLPIYPMLCMGFAVLAAQIFNSQKRWGYFLLGFSFWVSLGLSVNVIQEYFKDDNRKMMTDWIIKSISEGKTIGFERDHFSNPHIQLEDHSVQVIDWYSMYDESTKHVHENKLPFFIDAEKIPKNNFGLRTQESRKKMIQEFIERSDYIVLTKRHLINFEKIKGRFPEVDAFYFNLFARGGKFEMVHQVASPNTFWGWQLPDELFEQTTFIFDRPRIWIFKKLF